MVNVVTLFRIRKGETQNILEHWVASGCVATSFGRLVEPSQLVSSEIQIHVELGLA
jgi:hypothetical protein